MNDQTTQINPDPVPPERPRRLKRSSGDRVLAGVAGGLGDYFGVDPLLFRVAFALSVVFGGFGLIAYGLLWIFVPTDGPADAAQRLGARLRRMGFWRGLGLVALAALAICGLLALAGSAAFVVALGWGVPTAAVIIAAGVVLVLAAFRGGRMRWLIAPVLALAVGASAAAASNLDLRGGLGDRHYTPLSTRAIPADGYRLGVGQLLVDLRDLDWAKARTVDLKVDLGMGQAEVLVPENVCVQAQTHVAAGESEVTGERNDGFDVQNDVGGGPGAPRLRLNADVDAGDLRVINSDTAAPEQGDFDESSGSRGAERAACAR